MHTDAWLSNDKVYRYILIRRWEDGGQLLTFMMLNPSTADDKQDDPTIRRCIGFAKRFGYQGIAVINLFAYRATNPKELRNTDDAIGPMNDHVIRSTIASKHTSDFVLCAWGAGGSLACRDDIVVHQLLASGVQLKCLGKTKEGHPRHPLYLRLDSELQDLSS